MEIMALIRDVTQLRKLPASVSFDVSGALGWHTGHCTTPINYAQWQRSADEEPTSQDIELLKLRIHPTAAGKPPDFQPLAAREASLSSHRKPP